MTDAGHAPTAALAALLLGTMTGCAGASSGTGSPTAAAASEIITIRGSLTYVARLGLPPDSESVVELRDPAIPEGPVIAEQRTGLAGARVPVPFELTAMRASLAEGGTYAVRGAIVTGGRPSWVSEPVTIDIARPVVDLGLITLEPYTALAFVTRWACGGESVSLGYAGDQAMLMVGGDSIPVQPVPSASGVRYAAGLDPGTFIWSKGDRAMLRVRGRAYPECTHLAAPRP